jgi:hypothetical protein
VELPRTALAGRRPKPHGWGFGIVHPITIQPFQGGALAGGIKGVVEGAAVIETTEGVVAADLKALSRYVSSLIR